MCNFIAYMKKDQSRRMNRSRAVDARTVWRFREGSSSLFKDELAEERPLEIQLECGPRQSRQRHSVAVTMRSPGEDVDLALGFLFTEGIIGRRPDVANWQAFGHDWVDVLRVNLAEEVPVDGSRFERNFPATAACGLCGKRSLEQIRQNPLYPLPPGRPNIQAETVCGMAGPLFHAQAAFRSTGGMHAAALFSTEGRLVLHREDIGRHNALDKLIGAAWQEGLVPLYDHMVMLSGRAGFELVQKAGMAGVPVVASVGAASTLAAELAEEMGMTLIGFLREDRFNCYTGADRLRK